MSIKGMQERSILLIRQGNFPSKQISKQEISTFEPRHEISNNVGPAKAQTASHLNII